MMKKKKEINKVVDKMINSLDKNLLNQDLLQYIITSLSFANKSMYNTKIISENEILIERKNDAEFFDIEFEPDIENFSKITIATGTSEGREESVLTVDYSDGEYIVMTEHTITRLRDNDNIILRMTETKKKTIYRYNALRYSREYISTSNLHINNNDAETKLEEIVIDEECSAVKRVMDIQDSFNSSTTKYYETSRYDALPFNTRVNHSQVENPVMTETTEETFNTFVANLKNKKILERK